MSASWPTKPFGEVLQRIETVNPQLQPDVEFDYIDVSSISNRTFQIESTQRLAGKDAPSRARRLVKANDVLFATVRPTLQRIAVVPPHLDGQVCSTAYFVLRPREGLDPRFVFYSLFTDQFRGRMKSLEKGASYPAVTDGDLRTQAIAVPPLPEQLRIVSILNDAFEAIGSVRANTERNLGTSRGLLQTCFDAVFAQGDDKWVRRPFGGVCTFVRGPFGGSLKKATFVQEGYAVYEQSHAISNQFDDVRYFVDERKFQQMRRFEVMPNDIVMSCSGTMGRTAVVPEGVRRGIINQALLKLSPGSDVLPLFVKYWMDSQDFQDSLKGHSGGVAIQNVASVRVLKEIRMPVPDLPEQARVVQIFEEIDAEVRRLEAVVAEKVFALDALKHSILHQAFAGAMT